MSQSPEEAARYPNTMPGTVTENMSDGTHDKAVAQEYTLDDGGSATNPVGQGEHVRQVIDRTP